MLCLGTETWCFSPFELMWMNSLKMSSRPTVFWHKLDVKMGHVGEKERMGERPLTHSPVPGSCFPMAHNSLLPDLIDTQAQASEQHTHRDTHSNSCNRSLLPSHEILIYSSKFVLHIFILFYVSVPVFVIGN